MINFVNYSTHRSLRDYCTMHNVLFNYDFPKSNYTLYDCYFLRAGAGSRNVETIPRSAPGVS